MPDQPTDGISEEALEALMMCGGIDRRGDGGRESRGFLAGISSRDAFGIVRTRAWEDTSFDTPFYWRPYRSGTGGAPVLVADAGSHN